MERRPIRADRGGLAPVKFRRRRRRGVDQSAAGNGVGASEREIGSRNLGRSVGSATVSFPCFSLAEPLTSTAPPSASSRPPTPFHQKKEKTTTTRAKQKKNAVASATGAERGRRPSTHNSRGRSLGAKIKKKETKSCSCFIVDRLKVAFALDGASISRNLRHPIVCSKVV